MKLVILDGYTANPGDLTWDMFREFGELDVYDKTPPELLIERIGTADAVFVNSTALPAHILDTCPSIKYIGILATGYDRVDLNAARAHGITVTNVPAYSTYSVAQQAMAMLLEICNHTAVHSDAVHNGEWGRQNRSFWEYPLIELAGKTLGIIGLGQIGMALAKMASGMGMNVIAYSRTIREEGAAVARYVSFDELLAASDVISLNCPAFPETIGMINAETIAKMKDGVIFLNCSRGRLVVDEDLAEALTSGKIYAAGLDVVSQEPILENNPLLSAPNCFLTPHIGWAPVESRRRLIDIAYRNLVSWNNSNPENVVS